VSLGEAYTLGVQVTGDIASLRAELAAGNKVIADFANQSASSMARAAAAMEQSAATMQRAANRSTTGTKTQQTQVTASSRQIAADQQAMATRWVEAQRRAQSSTEQTTAAVRSSGSSIMATLGQLTGYAGLALLVKQVWDVGFGFNTFTQNTQIALTTLLGSQGAAKSFLADILEFAKETPYAFTDLTDQAQKLVTYGFATKDVIPILRSVGDAATAMGKGQEGVSSLVRALGQINAKGRLSSQELMQLSEIGVNGLKILANQAGMTTGEYQKLIEKGLIPADVAVEGLVNGINNGTDGVNGATVAFGGMMAQIKGAGGITATLDSTRTAFRNMAGAITENLVPAALSGLRGLQDLMGVVKSGAQTFGALPAPVQSAAIAMLAAGAAAHFLGPRLESVASSTTTAISEQVRYQRTLAAMSVSSDRAYSRVGRFSTAITTAGSVTRTAASSIGSGLLGAFGGGWGLAITGVTMAIAAFSSAQAQAQAAIQEVSATLDEQTGAVTDNTREWVKNQLSEKQTGIGPSESAYDQATKLGLGLDVVTDAALGNVAALEKVQDATKRWQTDSDYEQLQTRLKALGISEAEYAAAADIVSQRVAGSNGTIEEAIRVGKQKAAADNQGTDALTLQTSAVSANANAWVTWSEDQQKAIDEAGEAARKAADASFTTQKLDIASADEVASARDKVTDATKSLRDAEADREDTYARKGVSVNDKVRAEESVADARKALQDATESLTDTETRSDPVAQYRAKVQGIIDTTSTFVSDIQTLASKGLNATDLSQLIAQGPEASADTRKALLGDPTAIDFTNDARVTIDNLTGTLTTQAEVTQAGVLSGKAIGGNLGLGIQIALQEGSANTIQEIADSLGVSGYQIYNVGQSLGLQFLQGFNDASKFDLTKQERWATGMGGGGGLTAYASGGVYPGYTPGRDIGHIGVSGGEAIMRPEWTVAVGKGFVDHMNRIARTLGVGGVRAEMGRYLGGFAGGGTVPQVVTVPVHSTNERYSPVTVQRAYVVNAESLGVYGDRTKQMRRLGGGSHG
jgi:tape measure domain-containing protein